MMESYTTLLDELIFAHEFDLLNGDQVRIYFKAAVHEFIMKLECEDLPGLKAYVRIMGDKLCQ
jgi:hypothetical protein